jgi:hypothetical protein
MKVKGKKLEGRNKVIIPILRPEGNTILIAEAIDNYNEFDKLVQFPIAPIRTLPGGVKESYTADPAFLDRLAEYSNMRSNYIIIKSLSATPDIEWETVDITKPDTWINIRKELRESGLIESEVVRIINCISEANGLDDKVIERARNDFLAGAVKPEV